MARILHNSAPLDSEGCQGDSPPEAGFFQSRRASPEAHGSGSDSPACVGALVYSIFQPRSPRLQTHIPVHSATVCMWHASDKVLGVFRAGNGHSVTTHFLWHTSAEISPEPELFSDPISRRIRRRVLRAGCSFDESGIRDGCSFYI